MNGMFFRGEVYYVYPAGNEIGSEQHAVRPAIIVSNNQNNKNSSTLEIVYLTTREKKPMQTHVHINAAGKLQESTALCEQIFTVDKLRLNDYIGQLCDKEMQDIEFALMVSLDLDNYLSKPKEAPGTADIVGPVVTFPTRPRFLSRMLCRPFLMAARALCSLLFLLRGGILTSGSLSLLVPSAMFTGSCA